MLSLIPSLVMITATAQPTICDNRHDQMVNAHVNTPAVQLASQRGRKNRRAPQPKTVCKVIWLQHVQSESAAKHVRSLFQQGDKPNKMTWFGETNAVLMRGTPGEVEQMEQLLTAIDKQPAEGTGPAVDELRKVRIFSVTNTHAAALAETVAGALWIGRSKQGQIVVDTHTNSIIIKAPQAALQEAADLIHALDVAVGE